MLYFIGIGSNLGNREQTINSAIRCVNSMGELLGVAPFYYSRPEGFDSQNKFCNTAVALMSELSPAEVLRLCQQTEKQLGRKEQSVILPDGSKQYADREIDIDLLCAYDEGGLEVTRQTAKLTLPHPRMAERKFVQIPLHNLVNRVIQDSALTFYKMHGLGNDYIYFDCTSDSLPLLLMPVIRSAALVLCNRHKGIGADGLVFILPDKRADLRMRIFNADGSEAEMCGNAARCVGMYAMGYKHSVDGFSMTLATKSGIRKIKYELHDKISVEMGRPKFIGTHEIDGRIYHCVDVGNPHAVTFLNSREELTDELVSTLGPKIENHPLFPNKTNVEFCVFMSPLRILTRVWERGSGETQACGTGATAVAVACVKQGLLKRDGIISLPGGDLYIDYNNRTARMTGSARIVYKGTLSYINFNALR